MYKQIINNSRRRRGQVSKTIRLLGYMFAGLSKLRWCHAPILSIVFFSLVLSYWQHHQPIVILGSICPQMHKPTMLPHKATVSLAKEAARKHGVDYRLVLAVIAAESGCRVEAKSPKGAFGLMQLMPATADWLGLENWRNPGANIHGGTKYLAMLLGQFPEDHSLAIAAYNAGPTTVRKYKAIPPYRETQTYVTRVLEFYQQLGGKLSVVST